MNQKLVALVVLVLSAVSFAGTRAGEPVLVTGIDQTIDMMPTIGPGLRPIYSTIKFDAISTGCTDADDFAVEVQQAKDKQQLRIIRLNPDLCEVVAHPVEIVVQTQMLRRVASFPVTLANPLLVNEEVVH